MKISEREMTLGVVTLAALLLGGTWYVIGNRMDVWKARKSEIETLRKRMSLHSNAIKMQGQWLGDLNELQKELRFFEADQKSVSPELMKTIKDLSDKHRLDITRSRPESNEKQIGDLFELGINCTWEGSLKALIDFLGDLQQQSVRYDVRTLNITPVGNKTGLLKGNMVINCAYTRQET